jgi:acyl carrier protein
MEIAAAANFVALGISSRQAVTLTADLGDWLELDLPPNLLFVRQDLAALVGFLSESLGARG